VAESGLTPVVNDPGESMETPTDIAVAGIRGKVVKYDVLSKYDLFFVDVKRLIFFDWRGKI